MTHARAWALALLALAAVLSTCDGARNLVPTGASQDTTDVLRGTWLREYSEGGVKVRRVLTLEGDGAFRESAKVVNEAGEVTQFVHEGTWLYDGTNLKRKYTSMNGKPPSRLNVPFATFEIALESRNAFRGTDHVHRHEVHYRRVEPGTAP